MKFQLICCWSFYLYFICSIVHAGTSPSIEYCQKDDCRGGECEIVRTANGPAKKICHCVKGVCGDNCQRLCNSTSQCTTNPCWFGGTCVDIANLDYACLCPPNYTGKDCRTLISCQSNSCSNGGSCVQTGRSIYLTLLFFVNMFDLISIWCSM